ncbi:MAG: dihydroorotase [bacterium]|nr:dihydroorotase [bacterium]
MSPDGVLAVSAVSSADVSHYSFLVTPGLVDVHVHLREPGFFYKETIASGTKAAARGGYTAVCAMPNLNPAPDTMEHLQEQLDIIERDAEVWVMPYGCITMGQKGRGELCDFASMAPYVAGFSDDGKGVQDDDTMREAMKRVKAVGGMIVAHCEDESLLFNGYIHDGEYAKAHGHRGISSASEWKQVERDLQLVRETGCRYHVCHVSTKETVDLIRKAKAEGLDVTCETGPHYLTMCDMELQEDGRFKMNPPIRSAQDRDALVEGLLDGTIDIIATDHAPHSAEEKSRGLEKSLMGVVGLETAFAVLYTRLVKTGKVPLDVILRAMTDNPRKRFGLPENPDDFSVFDLDAQYTINPDTFVSMGHATPFEGWQVQGDCIYTSVGGEAVWQK